MSNRATFTFPNYRLSKILHQAGGKTIAAAVKDAEDGVATLKVSCLNSIDELLIEVDRRLKAFVAADDKTGPSDALYRGTNEIIGLAGSAGLKEMDRAAFSLCDLLDRMARIRRWDTDAVVVHVQALHLLRNPNSLGSAHAIRTVLEGLKKVRDKVLAAAGETGADTVGQSLS